MGSDAPSAPDLHEGRINLSRQRFYADLEARVKRYAPDEFGPAMVATMRRYHERGRIVGAPAHWVAQAIEANCAYARSGYGHRLDDEGYRRIHNVFAHFGDPASLALIDQDVNLFFLSMYREQMELQRDFAKPDVSRYYRLYMRGGPLDEADEYLKAEYGLSMQEWVKSAFVVFSMASGRSAQRAGQVVLPQPLRLEPIPLRPAALEAYLKHAASSVAEVGARFLELRKKWPPRFHGTIRPVFVERPLIRYDALRLLAPFPAMVFRHAQMGLYGLLEPLFRLRPSFGQAFGDHVQDYVGVVLRAAKDARLILTDRQLEKAASSKSADYLVEFDAYVLLVESKATLFTRDIITPSTIAADNSTRKLVRALPQVYQTARDLRDGRFDALGVSRHKPVYGVVATFGEIPFVNSPWYFDRYVMEPAKEKLDGSVYPAPNLVERPIVLPLDSLELLVGALNLLGTDLPTLVNERRTKGFAIVGDWDQYLQRMANERFGNRLGLPHMQEDFDEFFEALGVGRHERPGSSHAT